MVGVYPRHPGGCVYPRHHGGYSPLPAMLPGGYRSSPCYATRVGMVGIHRLVYAPTLHPWVYHQPPVPGAGRASSPAHAEVPRVRALGSEREKPMGEGLSSVLKSLKV